MPVLVDSVILRTADMRNEVTIRRRKNMKHKLSSQGIILIRKKGTPMMKSKIWIIFLGVFLLCVFFSVAAVYAAPFAYITNQGDSTVSVIDTSSNTVTDTITVGTLPDGVAVTPDGSRVYVANWFSNTVSVIDTSTNTVTDTIAVGSGPYGVAVTPDGSRFYVANTHDDTVSVIDTSSNTVTATIPVGSVPYGVAVTPDGSHVYVTNSGSSNVSVIDTSTNTVTTTINAVTNPYGGAVTPDGSHVYVANRTSDTVSVIDTSTNTVTDTIAVGSGPGAFGLFIGPAPASNNNGSCSQADLNAAYQRGYTDAVKALTSNGTTECAYYDFFTSTVHIPCFTTGGTNYWLDLGIYSGSPLLLDISNYGTK